MFKVIVHGLLARKFRLVATALAVTLGVAFMAGTLVLTDTFGQTFNDLSAGVTRAPTRWSGPQPSSTDRSSPVSSARSSMPRWPAPCAGFPAWPRPRAASWDTPG